jgi:hypothetical protein
VAQKQSKEARHRPAKAQSQQEPEQKLSVLLSQGELATNVSSELSDRAALAGALKRINNSNLGIMYGQWTLDAPVVEIAIAVAKDFVDRPSYFTAIPDEIAGDLEDLWYRSGFDPHFPDRPKRAAIFGAVFGTSDGASTQDEHLPSQFKIARDAALEAAVRYTQRTFDEGRLSLLSAFCDRLITLREYLTTFNGTALSRLHGQTTNMFDTCVRVLKSPEVARAYGLPAAPDEWSWPHHGNYSGKGAHLIEAIAQTIMPDQSAPITRQQVLAAQRIAYEGAWTLDATLEADLTFNNIALLDAIIARAFTWWTALQDAKPATSEPQAKQASSDVGGPALAVVPSSTKLLR